ncbi:hypothetical protein NDN08_004869 [Rhodosorus marinus]|uniref:Uncharacterized protein n=1 Tax=Rhodosorus marinus TaxID=101924 RepID=A0AAV8UI59_9RHOD|nr:hypothetical protein NDN08_004869 [Rhodosorus marinus]
MNLASLGSMRSFRLRGSSLTLTNNDKKIKETKKGNSMNSVLGETDNWLSGTDVLGHSEVLDSVTGSRIELFDDL